MKKYLSKAEWPKRYPEQAFADVSCDVHDTFEQANAVCGMLERLGLGGDGKVFPNATWVEEVEV